MFTRGLKEDPRRGRAPRWRTPGGKKKKKRKKEKNLLNLQAHPEECSALFFTGRRKRATSGARKNLARAINSRRSCPPLRGTARIAGRRGCRERKNETKRYIYICTQREKEKESRRIHVASCESDCERCFRAHHATPPLVGNKTPP